MNVEFKKPFKREDTQVPEVCLDFSSFRQAAKTGREEGFATPIFTASRLSRRASQLSHAERNQEKREIKKNL